MIKYYINNQGSIFVEDVGSIPQDPKNKDYARILREVAAGEAEIIQEGA